MHTLVININFYERDNLVTASWRTLCPTISMKKMSEVPVTIESPRAGVIITSLNIINVIEPRDTHNAGVVQTSLKANLRTQIPKTNRAR